MGAVERKEREKQLKREDIVDAAERIFAAKGYDHATMDDIAREADFSKRTVYMYFSSKEQLLLTILLRAFQKLNQEFERAMLEHVEISALEQIRVLGRIFHRFHAEYPLYFQTIAIFDNKESILRSEDPVVSACYQEGEKSIQLLKTILQRGIVEGSITSEINLNITALVLWSNVLGVANLVDKKKSYLEAYHHCTPEELIEGSYDLLLRGIQNTTQK